MMMQWLVNEWKDFREEIRQKVEGIQRSGKDEDLIERVTKLEGEVRMMKARAAKKNNKEADDQRRTDSAD